MHCGHNEDATGRPKPEDREGINVRTPEGAKQPAREQDGERNDRRACQRARGMEGRGKAARERAPGR